MIRYYAYFNYGGYKDLYLGCDKDVAISRYFLPLLPVMEQEEGMSEEVSRLKALSPIINLSSDTLEYNYPQDARVMISHAGYKIQYRMIGKTGIVALRDISGNKDMYGRSCPFLIMFVGDNSYDIKRLNIITYYLWKHTAEAEMMFSSLFVNDFAVNGLRFDVQKINTWFDEIVNAAEGALAANIHKDVRFLVVSEGLSFANAIAEQGITDRDVAVAYYENNYIKPCYGNHFPIAHDEQKNKDEGVNIDFQESQQEQDISQRKNVDEHLELKPQENQQEQEIHQHKNDLMETSGEKDDVKIDYLIENKKLLAKIVSLEKRVKELEHKMDVTWHKDC